ncbi:hypothetical protein CORC01_10516 [Colletotrichum orchidophilum]|uniref:WSC domain-containing protein n=1 Tax=Colletotrichum orchidophilum TaxID=1209926 RepID=A0A1G4AYD9_9PEZI|nr:uncharacterized protein CORC01_10516 [Colletotrichum orchidophilum]OHE94178.1 hypothetical protein CORC01_10516 [Colletotrichum orchidophilum]
MLNPLLVLLLAALVAAQANHVIYGFEYLGCVSVTSDKFDAFVDFGRGYTPEQCQSACTGRNYAATFPDGCRCGSSLKSFPVVNEALCSNSCNGDTSLGQCGFSNPPTCSYANLYKACNEMPPPSTPSPAGPAPTGPDGNDPGPDITYSTIRLPPVTRTVKLATRSTVIVQTNTPGGDGLTTSCTVLTGTPTTLMPTSPSAPTVVVQTVVVHVPPTRSTPGLQSYGSLQSDPPVATAPPVAPSAETYTNPPQSTPSSPSVTSLTPYDDPPVLVPPPGNVTIPVTTSTPQVPMFQTLILTDDPPAATATSTPAVVTQSSAHRLMAGCVGIVAGLLIAMGF